MTHQRAASPPGPGSLRTRLLLALLANTALLAVLAARSSRPPQGAFIGAAAFWLLLLMFPAGFNRRQLFSPRNLFLLLFFMSMVVGTALMLFDELLPRLWILTSASWDTSRIWPYMLPTSLLWALGFLAYLAGQQEPRDRLRTPGRTKPGGEQAADWMLLAGLALIAAGIAGLAAASGSLSTALAVQGRRTASTSLLVAGTYRYTVWMQGMPIGAALLWYYLVRRLRLRRLGAAAVLLGLYVPLVPFYVYSSGRATAIVPLVLLLALYQRFSHRFSGVWLIAGLVALLPALGAWSLYRQGVDEVSQPWAGAVEVAAGDLSRYDVSVAAVGGFHEGRMPYYLGRTLLAATTSWLPGSLAGQVDGTAAMAQAMVGRSSWNVPSSYASSLLVESYLNFGVLGVAAVLFGFGRLVRWLDRLAASSSLLTSLFALALALKLPFAISVAISSSNVFWAVGFPFAVVSITRWLLLPSTSRPAQHAQATTPPLRA